MDTEDSEDSEDRKIYLLGNDIRRMRQNLEYYRNCAEDMATWLRDAERQYERLNDGHPYGAP